MSAYCMKYIKRLDAVSSSMVGGTYEPFALDFMAEDFIATGKEALALCALVGAR